jgi:Tol biopolymer transport system component
VPIAGQVSSFLPSGAADFSVSDNGVLVYMRYTGRSQLAWVDREGRQTGTIGPDNALGKSGRISPDGRYVAAPKFDVERSAHDIWLFETGSDAGRRLVSGPGMAGAPVWSPDSRRIAFLRAVGGPPTMFVRGLGEKDLEEALPPGYFQIPTDWSPDGRFIAYMNTGFPRVPSEASADVWVIDLKRQPKAVPLLNSRFHETMAAFSPDGKWLAFLSDESARTEVYLQAFEAGDSPRVTGERLVVSRHGAVGLRWRPDGKELFYLGTDGRLYAVPIALSAKPAFGPPIPLFTISTEARAVIHSGFGFDVSRDGKRFLVPTAPSGGPSLIAIQNWEAALLKGSM